jgi:hypothetical protein
MVQSSPCLLGGSGYYVVRGGEKGCRGASLRAFADALCKKCFPVFSRRCMDVRVCGYVVLCGRYWKLYAMSPEYGLIVLQGCNGDPPRVEKVFVDVFRGRVGAEEITMLAPLAVSKVWCYFL